MLPSVCKANSLAFLPSSPKGLETWGNVLFLAPSNPEAPGPRPSREVQEAGAHPSTVSASPTPGPLHLPVVRLPPGRRGPSSQPAQPLAGSG